MATPLLGVTVPLDILQAAQVSIIPQGKIGGIDIQTTIEETYDDELEITDNPVQIGTEITDHSYRKPSGLILRCGWSNSSPEALLGQAISFVNGVSAAPSSALTTIQGSKAAASDYVTGVYFSLLRILQARQPIQVTTTMRLYQNVLLRGVNLIRDQKTSQALMVVARIREVIFVSTQSSTALPDASVMKTPAATSGSSNVYTQPLVESAQTQLTGAAATAPAPGSVDADDINLFP